MAIYDAWNSANKKNPFDYQKYRARMHRLNYKDKIVGAAKPSRWLRRPAKIEVISAAKRFIQDGEIANAEQMLKLIGWSDSQILELVRCIPLKT